MNVRAARNPKAAPISSFSYRERNESKREANRVEVVEEVKLRTEGLISLKTPGWAKSDNSFCTAPDMQK
jgi:hypothetical protein